MRSPGPSEPGQGSEGLGDGMGLEDTDNFERSTAYIVSYDDKFT